MRVRKLNIGMKLIISCMGLSIIIILMMTYVYYINSHNLIKKQMDNTTFNILHQTGSNIDILLEEYDSIIFNIKKDPIIQSYLKEEPSLDNFENYEQQKEMINRVYDYILYEPGVESVFIVTESGEKIEISKTLVKYDLNRDYKKNIYAEGGKTLWLESNYENGYISAGSQINHLLSMKPLGYIILNVSEESFSKVYSKMNAVKEGEVFIVNKNLKIISAENDETLIKRATNQNSQTLFETDNTLININNKQFKLSWTNVNNDEWFLVYGTPIISYRETLYNLKGSLSVLILIGMIISTLLSILITRQFSRPIKKLNETMTQFGKGDLNVTYKVHSGDEIGTLGNSFNLMAENINELLEKVSSEKILKKEAELKSLRMQINPHFLYNTLETVNWMARVKGIPEVGDIVKSLAEMMRYSIDGSEFSDLESELNNISNYLEIQKRRYGKSLIVKHLISEELLNVKTPKLILQPIIENALVHGFEETEHEQLLIIEARKVDSYLLVNIIDNGCGMSEEKLQEVRKKIQDTSSNDSEQHIGLQNVNLRLKRYYEELEGLKVHSKLGQGTKIEFKILIKDNFEPKNLISNEMVD
ncbi:cache domain-containing sensor histidine kinase [Enterococcus aquimarinus]